MHWKTYKRWMSPNPIDGGNGNLPPTPGNGGDVPPVAPIATPPPMPGDGGDVPPTEDKPAKTFTQVEVDRIAEAERKRGKQSVLKDIGVEKVEDARAAVKTARAIADTQKTDEQIIADKDRQIQDANRRAHDAQLRAAFMAKAGTRFVDPDAAFALADKSGLTVEEDGSVTGLAEALDTLADAKPYLVNKPGKPPIPSLGPPAPNGKQVARTDDDRRQEYFGGGTKTFFKAGNVSVKNKE